MRTDAVGYHHKQNTQFHNRRPEGAGDWLMLLVKTPAWFIIDGQKQYTKGNAFIIFTQDYPLEYGADGVEYIDDWLHFEPDEDERSMMQALDIPVNQLVEVGNLVAASDLIRSMCFEFYSAHQNRRELVNLYFRILLYKLNEQMDTHPADTAFMGNNPYANQLLWARTSMFRWPEQNWSADVFAKEMRLSASRFQHLYTESFGTTMLQDITAGRIQRACTLLEETDLPPEQIAEQCGYASVSHLLRVFRKHMGMTLLQYRKSRR